MQKHVLLASIFSFLILYPIHAQLFQKIDEDFEFNGTDLGRTGQENHTAGCTLLEEYESYRVYAPKKNVIKTKKFTLSNILYLTNMQNEIYQIQAMNTGDFVEKAQLRLDLIHGARNAQSWNDTTDNYLFYKFSRTTNAYKQKRNSDTAYVIVFTDWYLKETEEYRKKNTFLPVLGKSLKDYKTKEFLFAYEIPDLRSSYEELKWYYYYQFGMELFLVNDTIMQVAVFNPGEKFMKFKGALPFDLTIDDTRKIIREKFGEPPSASENDNTYYYRKPGLQMHITFANGIEPSTEKDKIDNIVFAVKDD